MTRHKKGKHYTSKTSKETLKRSGKYIPPNKSKSSKNPYVLLEKRFLEPLDAWIEQQAFINILGKLGNLAVIVAVVSFVFGESTRRNNEVFSAWQTITSAEGQSGSGGRIEALEFLNSRPLKFPWIGWTKESWYWDEREKECEFKRLLGLRWKRQFLEGLSAPKSILGNINLCGANLWQTNNLTFGQIKYACLWDKAIYKSKWNSKKQAYITIEAANNNFIEELKNDTASDPKKGPQDCSRWENSK